VPYLFILKFLFKQYEYAITICVTTATKIQGGTKKVSPFILAITTLSTVLPANFGQFFTQLVK